MQMNLIVTVAWFFWYWSNYHKLWIRKRNCYTWEWGRAKRQTERRIIWWVFRLWIWLWWGGGFSCMSRRLHFMNGVTFSFSFFMWFWVWTWWAHRFWVNWIRIAGYQSTEFFKGFYGLDIESTYLDLCRWWTYKRAKREFSHLSWS